MSGSDPAPERSPLARRLLWALALATGTGAAVSILLVLATLIRQRPVPGLIVLLIPAIPLLFVGQLWMIVGLNAERGDWGRGTKRWLPVIDPRRFFSAACAVTSLPGSSYWHSAARSHGPPRFRLWPVAAPPTATRHVRTSWLSTACMSACPKWSMSVRAPPSSASGPQRCSSSSACTLVRRSAARSDGGRAPIVTGEGNVGTRLVGSRPVMRRSSAPRACIRTARRR